MAEEGNDVVVAHKHEIFEIWVRFPEAVDKGFDGFSHQVLGKGAVKTDIGPKIGLAYTGIGSDIDDDTVYAAVVRQLLQFALERIFFVHTSFHASEVGEDECLQVGAADRGGQVGKDGRDAGTGAGELGDGEAKGLVRDKGAVATADAHIEVAAVVPGLEGDAFAGQTGKGRDADDGTCLCA